MATGILTATTGAAHAVLPGATQNIAATVSTLDRGGEVTAALTVFNPATGRQIDVIDSCNSGGGDTTTPCPSNPAYSFDGSQIVYARGPLSPGGAPTRLVIRNQDGSSPRTLPLLTDSDDDPVFSPPGDSLGNQIAFVGTQNGRQNIYIVRDDGSGLRQLTFAGGLSPAWSLRNRIAFVRRGRIYTIGANGRNRTRLRRGANPDFSPSGRRIVYQRTLRGRTRLYILRSLRRYRRFTRGSGFTPSWSPDGGRIAFSRPSDPADAAPGLADSLMTVRLNRTGLFTVFAGQADTCRPCMSATDGTWQPN